MPPAKKKEFTVDVMVEDSSGKLVFKPVKVSSNDLQTLLNATQNPTVKFDDEKISKIKKHMEVL
ncbi:MAG: hypothetical protein Q7K42_02735 [Candidatus Diapherotrites archaeon]|nr:hypothetical protein [Candidatus Diapherotrites archaeon]